MEGLHILLRENGRINLSLNTSWRLPSVAVICKIPILYNQHFFLYITVASTSINPVTLKTGSKFLQNVKTFNHYTQKTIIRIFIQFRWYHQSLCSKWHYSLCDTQSCINMWITGPILQSESYHSSLCSQAAMSGFCILLYTLQLCCTKILIWTNFVIATNKEYYKIYRMHFETP